MLANDWFSVVIPFWPDDTTTQSMAGIYKRKSYMKLLNDNEDPTAIKNRLTIIITILN